MNKHVSEQRPRAGNKSSHIRRKGHPLKDLFIKSPYPGIATAEIIDHFYKCQYHKYHQVDGYEHG
jgi:hypothetical protein